MYDTKQLLAVLMLVAMASGVAAQNYPTKPRRMILPFPPGGPTDLVGRLLAQKLGEQLGQQVASDNRPGASGNIGLELAAKAPQDGYTIVLKNAEVLVWYGILTPTGTPAALVNRLNSEIVKAVNAPDTHERFITAGVEPMTSTPEQFGQFIRSEATRFGKVIREAGIRGE